MESVEATLTPKGFSCQGLNALVSLGAYFVNKRGERFMFKYDKKGENARRAVIADAAINEYLLGNGPVYLDCRHLPQDMLDRMEYTLQVDRYTLPAYYKQKGVNFREELVEISISELSHPAQRRLLPRQRPGGGHKRRDLGRGALRRRRLRHGERRHRGRRGAGAHSGRGRGAAGAIERTARCLPLPRIGFKRCGRSRICISAAGTGMTWKQFEDETRQTVTDYVGVRRTDTGLRLALRTLRALAGREPTLVADDLHGLMRVHEAKNIRMNAEIMATASLARTETRTGSSHWRLDYPETDDKNWRKFVLVDRGGDGPRVRTLSTERPLSDAFARSAA